MIEGKKKTKLYLEEEKRQMIKFKEWKMVCVAPFFVKVLLKRKIPHLPTTCNNWCRIRQRQMREEIQRVFLWLWAICLSCRHNTVKHKVHVYVCIYYTDVTYILQRQWIWRKFEKKASSIIMHKRQNCTFWSG